MIMPQWRMFKTLSASMLCLPLAACAAGPAVLGSEHLPVKRIVMYRNGVAYFERAGQVVGSDLQFSVRAPHVGDFLSSLTAVQGQGDAVRSVSFAVPEPEASDEQETLIPPPDPRVDVRLLFADDGQHDVAVAYVVESPIWRPAYRVLADEAGVLLQAWAVVQNTSGEDWRSVQLSLTTGAPISFRSDLGTPIVPERPFVTDEGEVVAAVPQGETVLAQRQEAAAQGADDAASDNEAAYAYEEDLAEPEMAEMAAAPVMSKRMVDRRRAVAKPAPAPPMVAPVPVEPLAQATAVGETVTRYDLQERVDIPDGGSTMVAVVSQRVPGKRAYLFAPEPGVAASNSHPFAVVRMDNETGAHLERGPIAVYAEGNFLGQGVLQPLPIGASAFVPYALERGITVEHSAKGDEQEGRLVRIERGSVVVERFSVRTSGYLLRNGATAAAQVFIRHPRIVGAELVAPPAGTELTTTHALVPVSVPGQGEMQQEVVERTPVQRTVDFISDMAADAVALYLQGPAVDAAAGPVLTEALRVRSELVQAQAEQAKLERARGLAQESAFETRENLKALRKVKTAEDLRTRLTQRLSELDLRAAELTAQVVERDAKMDELRVRLSELLREVTLVPADNSK